MIDSTLDLLSAQPEKDALYYLIPVTLKIEDTLFRIPRFILMSNSPIFQDMFAIPQGEGGTTQIEGSRDTNPIILDHVKQDDFRHLLDVVLPLDVPPTEPVLSKEAWVAVLRLADMWEMHRIRLHCIDKLTDMSMSPVERLVLAKNFHVPQWLHTGYTDLVNRNETLSMSDSENIGYRSAVGVFQLREQRLRWIYENYRYGYRIGEQKFTLNSVFEDELADEEAIFQTYAAAIDTTNPVPAPNAAPTPTVGGAHVDSQTSQLISQADTLSRL